MHQHYQFTPPRVGSSFSSLPACWAYALAAAAAASSPSCPSGLPCCFTAGRHVHLLLPVNFQNLLEYHLKNCLLSQLYEFHNVLYHWQLKGSSWLVITIVFFARLYQWHRYFQWLQQAVATVATAHQCWGNAQNSPGSSSRVVWTCQYYTGSYTRWETSSPANIVMNVDILCENVCWLNWVG